LAVNFGMLVSNSEGVGKETKFHWHSAWLLVLWDGKLIMHVNS